MEATEARPTARALLISAILCLFFLRLLTDFIAAVYAFGLMGTSIPPEIASMLFFFAPLLLLLRRKALPAGWLIVLGALLALLGAAEVLLPTRYRMLACGAGVGAGLLLLPAWLARESDARSSHSASTLGVGLGLGLGLFMLLRAWSSGIDATHAAWYRASGWVLLAIGAAALPVGVRRARPQDASSPKSTPRPRFGAALACSLGLMAGVVLLYAAYSSPNVIARWAGANYLAVLALVASALCVWVLWASLAPRSLYGLPPWLLLLWNALYVAALATALRAQQFPFPAQPGGYAYYEPAASTLGILALYASCALFPVILVDIVHLGRALIGLRPSMRALGGAWTLASLFAFVMILAQVFTTVYDYIPVVGPPLRDQFWAVHLALGLVLAAPILLILRRPAPTAHAPLARVTPVLALVLLAVTLVGGLVTAARPAAAPADAPRLRVLTYNVQQGYSADTALSHAGLLALMRRLDADIIGLQESDTNRTAGGNTDLVRYLADGLDYYAYYGPNVVVGTFGIALLSRYPIQNPRTFYMYSIGEQTASILALVEVGGRTYNVLVTHLGNDGPIVQQEAVLRELQGLPNVVAMGDYNFRPDTAQYALTTAQLDEAWLLRWPNGEDGTAQSRARRIDYVFVSPGTTVADAYYLDEPLSDHPALFVELGW